MLRTERTEGRENIQRQEHPTVPLANHIYRLTLVPVGIPNLSSTLPGFPETLKGHLGK